MLETYTLSEEHRALQSAVRELVADKVTPYAAAVDEEARFPQEAFDAMRAADLHAVHIPEQYGGNGADALATCLVIEEVARGCASSSLHTRANAFGSLTLRSGCPSDTSDNMHSSEKLIVSTLLVCMHWVHRVRSAPPRQDLELAECTREGTWMVYWAMQDTSSIETCLSAP